MKKLIAGLAVVGASFAFASSAEASTAATKHCGKTWRVDAGAYIKVDEIVQSGKPFLSCYTARRIARTAYSDGSPYRSGGRTWRITQSMGITIYRSSGPYVIKSTYPKFW